MTKVNYTHIQVADNGVGKLECPFEIPRFTGGAYDFDTKYRDWQAQYSHLTFTCLDADGNFVKPGRYSVEHFGDALTQTRRFNRWIDGYHHGEHRNVLYLKAQEVKEEKPTTRTAIDILSDYTVEGRECYTVEDILNAMHEYANQFKYPTIEPSIEQAAEPFAVANQFQQHQDMDIKYLRKVIDEKCNKWKEFKNYHEDDKEIMMSLMIQGANHLKQKGWKSKEEVEGIINEVLHRASINSEYGISQNDDGMEPFHHQDNIFINRQSILTTEYKDLL